MSEAFYYGGQAVIQGVMIRGQRNISLAVRCPDGGLTLITKPLATLYTGKIRKAPLLRGVFVLIESLFLGIQTLLQSANISLGEEEKTPNAMVWGILVLSLAFATGLFFVVPLLLVNLVDPYLPNSMVSSLVEGIIRIGIFLLYLGVLNLMPDIRNVFAYHGAEHKVVNAYEAGASLELEAVKEYSTAHIRCGTSFLLAVLILSILVFALLPQQEMWLRILSRILLIPIIAAIGYEFTRLGAAHAHNPVMHVLLAPGLALQAMTTRQPNDSQLETALLALKGAIEADNVGEASTHVDYQAHQPFNDKQNPELEGIPSPVQQDQSLVQEVLKGAIALAG